ncbi:hypothetical protein U1Q18_010590, partial [Sarracenia purpurea var. burkii]
IRLLEASFDLNKWLDPERKSRLAQELGLPPRKVAVWYQNKRARWKNRSLEEDHEALRQRLESVLAENQRLEKEVERLREELDKTHRDMLVSFTVPPYNSCDEAAGSSSFLHLGSEHHLEKEIYGCNFFAAPSVSL